MGESAVRARLQRVCDVLKMDELRRRVQLRDTSRVVARANEVLADTFTFTKIWDMERCETPFTLTTYDWNIVNNDDEEWCFMLNRMDYLEDLALAWLATDDERYARKAAELMESWAAAHPVMKAELSTRTLDTGIRLRTMVSVLPTLVYAGVMDDAALERVVASVRDQIAYLRASYLPKYELSNWGTIQTLAILFALAVLDDDPTASNDWAWARDRAQSELRAQVYPDGIDWELSTMYHIEVLLCTLRTLRMLELLDIEVPAGLLEAAERLAHGVAAQMMPTGEMDAQGDSDRSDVRPLLALCAGVLGDAGLKRASGQNELAVDDLFCYGCPTEDCLAVLPVGEELPRTFDGMDSGLFTMRSSWDADANYAMVLHGPLGSGHGHADNQHVTYAWRGVPVLIDGGRYSYREDVPERPGLRGAAAHNVPLIDGRTNSVATGAWEYDDFAYPLKPYVRHVPGAHYVEGALVGHAPVTVVTRKLVVLDCGVLVGVDEAYADGAHELEARFHLDPAAQAERVADATAGAELGDVVRVTCAAGELQLGAQGAFGLTRDRCSLAYNELSDQDVAVARRSFTDAGSQLWWLAPADVAVSAVPVLRNGKDAVDASLAEAVRFDVPGAGSYTLAFFYQEVYMSGGKAFTCEGVSFHAGVVLIHEHDGQQELHILRG